MAIVKVASRYRGEVGTERVNRDGKMEVLKPSDVEVTYWDRFKWYAKGTLEREGIQPDDRYPVSHDDGGNPMRIKNLSDRTQAVNTHADGRGDDPPFSNRRVEYTVFSVLFL